MSLGTAERLYGITYPTFTIAYGKPYIVCPTFTIDFPIITNDFRTSTNGFCSTYIEFPHDYLAFTLSGSDES